MAAKWDLEMIRNRGGLKWAYVGFLGILVLHGLAILFFTRGFLLTRSELPNYSQCEDITESPCFPPTPDQNGSRGCWTKPAVDRLVIIVLDALRFDFAAPSTFFPEKKTWMDKLEVLHELASQNPAAAKIFKAVADPPTTSLQRLKGLTTGGLPTFIDVGNSFGAPAIVEDNLIHQLVQNGKRVVMMGDDTWMQLFPHHFIRSYPFPSFNVKDLHTVDDGCTTNLIPTLYEKDWDVLIAHFLGMDHAGHIFGVNSSPMIEKLEQYNEMIKKVVDVLESQNGPGGLHENTMLVIMGDHGQTLNGDHGGGTAEEVETAIFALSLKKHLSPQLAAADSSTCQIDMHGKRICIGSIQQLDFSATVSALLGLPFPFGSIGHVNSELYYLAGGTLNYKKPTTSFDESPSGVDKWIEDYANVLCINSWQVKKYIDAYSSLSLIGFSEKDLLLVSELYSKAQELWSVTSKNISLNKSRRSSEILPLVNMQLDAYSLFLESVAALARSNWTEFNLKMMGIGFCIMLTSLYLHLSFIKRLDKLCGLDSCLSGYYMNLFGINLACFMVLIRAFSFLSNSYILEEGRVASFLLATLSVLQLRFAIRKKTMLLEALGLCVLIPLLRISIELGQLKQAVNSLFLKVDHSKGFDISVDPRFWVCANEVIPILALTIIAYVLYKRIISCSRHSILTSVVAITLFNYMLILFYWAVDNRILALDLWLGFMKGDLIPRVTYAAGLLQLLLLAFFRGSATKRGSQTGEPALESVGKALALLSAWSPTIIILSGKRGSLAVLALLIGACSFLCLLWHLMNYYPPYFMGWCISRLMALVMDSNNEYARSSLFYALPVTQWNLLAVCMFFSTGHWCAFDGLSYAAAFVGFDEFHLIRQAILLTIETFGFSLILPILALPLLIASSYSPEQNRHIFFIRLCQVYLMYGLITAISVTFTMLCVAIQRRHLMVWGLFAPKFVFDVVGLLLTDFAIFLSAIFYIE